MQHIPIIMMSDVIISTTYNKINLVTHDKM